MRKYVQLPALAAAALLLHGCSGTRPADPWQCAVVGGAATGIVGAGIGANIEDDDEAENAGIGAAAGAALGALGGYLWCAMLPEGARQAEPVTAPVKRAPVVKKTVVLPGVNFEFARSDLRAEARNTLDDEVIPELRADPSLSVEIDGHTDAVGSDEYNEKLSEQRARSVASYLVSRGIESSRVTTRGLGETQPVATNDTAEGRARNRRVELRVMQ
jgi:outer membrane protein OmpA-like peptidoglycan-associated protein